MSSNVFKSIALFLGLALSLGILVVGVLSLRSFLTRATGSSEPQNVRTANITDANASVLWETSQQTQGIVRFATDPNSFSLGNSSGLLFAAETSPSTKHEVKLSFLKPSTTYYYEIAIGDNVYDQTGIVKENKHLPYTFTTAKATSSETSTIPTLDAATFRQKFGTTDSLYDLNKDGIVNSTDYLLYLSRSASPTP